MSQDTGEYEFIGADWVRRNPGEASALIKLLIMRKCGGSFDYHSEVEAAASTIPIIIARDDKQGSKTVRMLREHMRQGEGHDSETKADKERGKGEG